MSNPLTKETPTPDSEEAILEALLLAHINWLVGDTGSAVDAILTHFTRRTAGDNNGR